MKLATLKDGSRDGMLAVVSRDLKTAHLADGIAPTLQRALDDWPFIGPQLEELSLALNAGRAKRPFDFVPANCMAPLPRAFQWIDGSTYAQHVELLMRARGAKPPDNLWREPRMYQGGSDDFLGPCDDAPFEEEHWDIDFEPELAVVLGDTPMHVRRDEALEHVRLVMLANDWSLRSLAGAELGRGFGFLQSKPATAFAPLAVTPDELGEAWRDGLAHLTVSVTWNGTAFTTVQSGAGTKFGFAELIAHAGRTRSLRAGSIIGSGTVSGPGGVGCIAEKRAAEALEAKEAREAAARAAPAPSEAEVEAEAAPVEAAGDPVHEPARGPAASVTTGPRTEFLRFGDRVRIEALDSHGHSMFGALDQQVVAYKRRRPAPVAVAAPMPAADGALAATAGEALAAGPGEETGPITPVVDTEAGTPAAGAIDAVAEETPVAHGAEADEPGVAEGVTADGAQAPDEAVPETVAAADSGAEGEAGGPAAALAEATLVPEDAGAVGGADADGGASSDAGPVAAPPAGDAESTASPTGSTADATPEEPAQPAADAAHKSAGPEDDAAPGAAHSS